MTPAETPTECADCIVIRGDDYQPQEVDPHLDALHAKVESLRLDYKAAMESVGDLKRQLASKDARIRELVRLLRRVQWWFNGGDMGQSYPLEAAVRAALARERPT